MIRDTLKAQIEQIGKNIRKIVERFLEVEKLHEITLFEERQKAIQKANSELKEELDIDIELIANSPIEELSDYFSERKLIDKHVEVLADYTEAIARSLMEKPKEYHFWMQRTILLLDVADKLSQSLSMNRMERKRKLMQLLT